MVIKIDGVEYEATAAESKAARIEKWYDRHRREWVIYPVDENGYQLAGAVYGYSKAEANRIAKELEIEYQL